MNRRKFLHSALLASAALCLPASRAGAAAAAPFQLPPLRYAFNALEPYIDAQTMEIHHDKHHKAYVDNLNKAVGGSEYAEWTLDELLRRLDDLPKNVQNAVRNNGGGHYNHTLFWEVLTPSAQPTRPEGPLAGAIQRSFGGLDQLAKLMREQGLGRFGSGWVWLCQDSAGELNVITTPNQNCPISEGHHPLLGLDVWEHAYYLKYQNRRADYLDAIWKVVNWNKVGARFKA